jgi:hypothetical protein
MAKHRLIAAFNGQQFTRDTDMDLSHVVIARTDRARYEADKLRQVQAAEREAWAYWSDVANGKFDGLHDEASRETLMKMARKALAGGLESRTTSQLSKTHAQIEAMASNGRFTDYFVVAWTGTLEGAEEKAAIARQQAYCLADVQTIAVQTLVNA